MWQKRLRDSDLDEQVSSNFEDNHEEYFTFRWFHLTIDKFEFLYLYLYILTQHVNMNRKLHENIVKSHERIHMVK